MVTGVGAAMLSMVLATRSTAVRVPVDICRHACAPAVAVRCGRLRRHAYRRCRRTLVRACRKTGPTSCDVTSTSTSSSTTTSTVPSPPAVRHIDTVFIVVMENHDWSQIAGNPAAPYINDVLLPAGSHAEQYVNLPGIHPSEPNYLWLEAGTNFGILDDAGPATNHLSTTEHLVALLDSAGVSWRAYEEDISGTTCPVTDTGRYAVDHDPFVFFDGVSGRETGSPAYCILHIRPYSELRADLLADTVARYNFITPNLCHDMHQSCSGTSDPVADGDTWLSTLVPTIIGSPAYARGGVLFIAWDESSSIEAPIGMIVLSPFAKGVGYPNTIRYTHSSTLRTIEEIFGVAPMLGGAATATDLSDLFAVFP